MPNHVQFKTHEVTNQPKPLTDYNAWETDAALKDAVEREGGGWGKDRLSEYGAVVGGELIELGRLANENKPVFKPFDRYGHRIDEVEFHPAYHDIMRLAMHHEVQSFSWNHEDQAGAHVIRAALIYMSNQAEAGTCCPLTMTHAAIPTLRHAPGLADEWIPKLTGQEYDPRSVPAGDKSTCTMGMGMTEKQGGSDVRSNTTRAERLADGNYQLIGHKWFYSAPMCDAHLVLAQAEGGLSCFLVPRILPDGSLNAVRVQRLKDKLGDWSNASSEVEFLGAWSQPVGDEGRGVATILQMVALTRLDCMLGSAGLMRQALVQAIHHCRQREAFGKTLTDQPLMQNVLADLALESEAAIALTLRITRAVDRSENDPREAAFARIAMPIGKYWICKRCAPAVNEAQECLGGIGYVEENNLPRLYRQAPLNSIWEGSGNVQCLDVLRALQRAPEVRQALLDELAQAQGYSQEYDREVMWLTQALDNMEGLEARSRYVVERAAIALQAAVLFQACNNTVADAFCRSRIGNEHGLAFGTLASDTPFTDLIDRTFPPL